MQHFFLSSLLICQFSLSLFPESEYYLIVRTGSIFDQDGIILQEDCRDFYQIHHTPFQLSLPESSRRVFVDFPLSKR